MLLETQKNVIKNVIRNINKYAKQIFFDLISREKTLKQRLIENELFVTVIKTDIPTRGHP